MKIEICGLVLCFVVLSSITDTSELVPDVTVIYSHNTTSGYADLQVRTGTNSIGKLFVLNNETVLVPEASPQSIQNLQCLFEDKVEVFGVFDATCKWALKGPWEKKEMDYDDIKALSLKIPGQSLLCEFNNGDCQMWCENTIAGPQCSCPPPFVLNSDGRTCSLNESDVTVYNDSSGQIKSPNYPYEYPNNFERKWAILAPVDHKIVLDITSFRTELNYDHLQVTGKNLNTSVHGASYPKSLTTESGVMLLKFTSDHSNTFSGFFMLYRTVPYVRVKSKILNSTSGSATAEFPLNFASTNLCVSVVYHLRQSAKVKVFVRYGYVETLFSSNQTFEENGWALSLFTPPTGYSGTGEPRTLIVKCSDRPCIIASIADCTHNGEVYSLGSLQKKSSQLVTATSADRKQCFSGGFFNSSDNVCLCPPGFTGNKCEEACGPNRFGDKCQSMCSSFNKGCKNMIFCNSANKCMCASGFRGEVCQEECINGYGSMCFNDCGECNDGICDKFTGECIFGCKDGFYPPNCQDRYLTLRNPPSIKVTCWFSVLMTIEPKNISGKGIPHLYSVQHKEKGSNIWLTSFPQAINNNQNISVNLTGLKAGINYTSRVILISEDGNSYQGPLVPELEFCTKCEGPDSVNYEIKASNVTTSSFNVEWKYKTLDDKWCPILSYDVILQDTWRKFYQKISSRNDIHAVYSDLWPGHQYDIFICARTLWGKAPCSPPFNITTLEGAPGKVKYLSVQSRTARNVHISWKRPFFSGGIIKGYKVQYECVKYFSCNATCENSNGTIETTQMSTIIPGLLPYSQYKIRVAAHTTIQGPFTSVYALTNSEKPDNVPMASENFLISKSNSSLTVQWKPPQCFGLNGNFQGYFFTLSNLFENGTISNVTSSGSTMDTQTTVVGLMPKKDYELHVYTVNNHGWNPHHKLQILLSTSATVPGAVTNLEVYKSGRRMLGIRWGKPSKLYGELKSFTVVYRRVGTDISINETILPTPCQGWPDLYCHTINSNLQPEKQYTVSVMARNNEIDEDGVASEITAQCREFAPEAPSFLRILKADSTSFEMEWGVPRKFNGELRSFIVNVEHIDAANDTLCCEYFPVQELPFREENSLYSLVVDGLIPASAYITSVSAKTVLLGPSVNITFYTPPEPTTTLRSPQITKLSNGTYSVQLFKPSTIHHRIPIHPRMNSVILLLILHDNPNITSNIWYPDVLDKLTKAVKRKFYIASEISFNEGESEKNIVIGAGKTVQNGTVGEIRDPKFIPGEYQVGLALLQVFGDAISVSFKASNNFKSF